MHEQQSTRYIIALRPKELAVNETFNKMAFHLAANAEGYLLGEEALPHVTICHFTPSVSSEIDWPVEVWARIPHTPLSIALVGVYCHAGEGKHAGTAWLGLCVKPTPDLKHLHDRVRLALNELPLEVGPPSSQEFFPHLTLARLNRVPADLLKFSPEDPILHNRKIDCILTIGQRGENGTYRNQLRP